MKRIGFLTRERKYINLIEEVIKELIKERAKQLGYNKEEMPNREDITDEALLWLMNELDKTCDIKREE